jgi:glycosyltransferase involved in cell wall biosynthesis
LTGRRITFVTNGHPVGGAETQLIRIAGALARSGDDVKVISLLPSSELVDRLRALEVPVAVLKIFKPLRALTAVVSGIRQLLRQRPEVLVCFDYQSIVLGRLAGKAAKVPVVISSIRNERFGGRARERLIRATDRLGSVTVVNSGIIGDDIERRRIVPRDRLVVIPNGIDLKAHRSVLQERSRVRQALGVETDQFVWLSAGRLWKQKDYSTLLAAFAASESRKRGARLLIAGDGPLRSALGDRALELGIPDQVDFLGQRSDLPELMAAADAFVMSSAWEGLPNVIMEAMATGLPVVATRVGGVPELVDHRVTGLLADAGQQGALATEMDILAGMAEDLRHTLGRAGRSVIEETYQLDIVIKQWSDLIDMYLEVSHREGLNG